MKLAGGSLLFAKADGIRNIRLKAVSVFFMIMLDLESLTEHRGV
jgi:hypothetical protein